MKLSSNYYIEMFEFLYLKYKIYKLNRESKEIKTLIEKIKQKIND